MDPVPASAASALNATQASARADQAAGLPAAPPLPALLALAGQDVAMLLLGQAAGGGVSLALPGGQVLTAQGSLPYPDGTQLMVRVLASGADAPVRLQIQQAAPPSPPAILAPLYQGEAAALLASLGQAEPPPGLAPLAGLLQLLGGLDAGAQALPDPGQVQAAVQSLPAQSQAALKTLLDLPPGTSTSALATALEGWMAGSGAASSGAAGPGAAGPGAAGPGAAATAGGAAPRAATPIQAIIQDLLQRFQAASDRHPDLPQADTLAGWFRQLVASPEARSAPARDPSSAGGTGSPAQTLQTLLGGRSGAPADAPGTWEAWLRTSIRALSDPAVAPQSAAFHAAQAKEGTAYYEIPLPWAPQHPLQMWMESDRDPRDPSDPREETQRVLLGLSFTNLGETRVGIARRGADLRVRVWTEHPELLESSKAEVEGELRDLGGSVDLQILPLTPGPDGGIPTVRSQVAGAALQALG